MQLKTIFAVSAALAMFAAPRGSKAQSLYVLTNDTSQLSGATTDFGTIDVTTGAYTSIASLSGAIGNLAWDSSNTRFWVTKGQSTGASLNTLSTTGTLDPAIGLVNLTIYGMAYRQSDNRLYAYNYSSADTGWINPTTGAWTLTNSSIGISVLSPRGGRYSILNDTLYFAANYNNGGLYNIDYVTGAVTLIGFENTFANMVLANDGTTMYGLVGNGNVGQQALYTVNTSTGTTNFVAYITGTNLGTRFHGAYFVPSSGTTGGGGAVPEPGEWAAMGVLGAGLTGLIVRKRRKG